MIYKKGCKDFKKCIYLDMPYYFVRYLEIFS